MEIKASDPRGVVYLGSLPFGFFESQMRTFFSQFGVVTRLRLSRNKKVGSFLSSPPFSFPSRFSPLPLFCLSFPLCSFVFLCFFTRFPSLLIRYFTSPPSSSPLLRPLYHLLVTSRLANPSITRSLNSWTPLWRASLRTR